MKDSTPSLNQWLRNFDQNMYDSPDVSTQCSAGWYDWFCKDSALRAKLYKLAPKVAKIAKSPKIDADKTYVWFKNNCPMNGSLYDDFRIADLETGETLYTITPASGHNICKGRAEVWSRADNNFKGPVVAGTWRDVLNYFAHECVGVP